LMVVNNLHPCRTLRRPALALRAYVLALSAWSVCLASGGTWDRWNLFTPPTPPPPPVDSFVLRTGGLEQEKQPAEGTVEAKLAGGKELFRQGDYDKAERVFHHIADDTHNEQALAEEARFYEAECNRVRGDLPKAADLYIKMMKDFPTGAFREQANQHLYDIADKWLDDTRVEMQEAREVRDGKRWMTTPHFIHLDQESPFLDKEGRALEALDNVHINDILSSKGQDRLADKALFLKANVLFFNEDYRAADSYFQQLVDTYPDSPFAPRAVELGIICKRMGTGGPYYDGRKVAEARMLVDKALRSYPELANGEKREFMERQLVEIQIQQAAKDYEVAEFYRRTDHPAPAYFMYEVVRRRYPGTTYADEATRRMHEIHDAAEKEKEKEGKKAPVPPVPPASGPIQQVGGTGAPRP